MRTIQREGLSVVTPEQAASARDPAERDPQAPDGGRARAEPWTQSVFTELCDLIGAVAAGRILTLFRADLNARFADVGNRDALRRDAHAMKSTAGMLGFEDLSQSAAIVEADCESGRDLTRSLGELMRARDEAYDAVVAFEAVQREPARLERSAVAAVSSRF